MLRRFSSRRQHLDTGFLRPRLSAAKAYDRIAGYFSSSILEVAGEALESVEGMVRVVCNSGLTREDVEIAKLAQAAMRWEWCDTKPEALPDEARERFRRLFHLLAAGKLLVRVLPDDVFGLIHGKAGVITLADGSKTAFLGSANESRSAFRLNYELIWGDPSPDAVAWVQEEFDALWTSLFAVDLAEFVIQDIERLSRRSEVPDVGSWREKPDPASPVIESPVYRKEVGLWEHQKYFVKLAFDAHRGPLGARFVLADQVGLGKTLQLAMAAQLMALMGHKPVLILAPKPLIWQWQDELNTLLDMPSAVWDGKHWVDENGIEHPSAGPEAIRRCPRRVGIVSTGLVMHRSEVVDFLVHMSFECVILRRGPPRPSQESGTRKGARSGGPQQSAALHPATPRHPDQPGPALESIPIGAAQRTHPADRPGARYRRHLQHALRWFGRGPGASFTFATAGEHLKALWAAT